MTPRRLAVLLALVALPACAHVAAAPLTTRAGLEARLAEAHRAGAQGEWARASRLYGQVLSVDRTRLAAHRGLVEAAFNLGHLAQVEDRYQAVLRRHPDDPYALYGLAIARYADSTANAPGCLEDLARAAALKPQEADFPFRAGVILLEAERWPEAQKALARAVALAPKVARYRVPYALALFHAGHLDAALDALRDLLDLDPSPSAVKQARKVADRITDPFRHVPDSVRGQLNRAIDWLEKADVPQNALDILDKVAEQYPDLAIAQGLMGLAYERIENGGEAMVHFRRAVKLAPDLPQPHLYLANFLYSHQRFDEARKAYLAALAHDPLMVEAIQMLARLAMRREDTPEAVKYLERWSRLAPKAPGPKLQLARVLAGAGNLDGAQAALESVLRRDPGNLAAHLSLGALLVRRHQLAKGRRQRDGYARQARRHLRKVLSAQPDNAAAQRLMAQLGS